MAEPVERAKWKLFFQLIQLHCDIACIATKIKICAIPNWKTIG